MAASILRQHLWPHTGHSKKALIFYRFSIANLSPAREAITSTRASSSMRQFESKNSDRGGDSQFPVSSNSFLEQSNGGGAQRRSYFDSLSNGLHTSASLSSVYKMSNPVELLPVERAKRFAAYACGEAEIKSGMSLGIGSGSTIKYLIDWLYEKHSKGELNYINCVSTSFQTLEWLRQARLPVFSLDELNILDLAIDGADEVDSQLTCVKGGGGCLLREKIVQSCAKRFILIGNLEKYSDVLGTSYECCAIEVVPFAYVPVKRWIETKTGGKCVLRMDSRKCFPSVTENSNYILDWHFPKPVLPGTDWTQINKTLLNIPGVVETGFFIEVAEAAYFGSPNGQISKVLPKKLNRIPMTEEGKLDPNYVTQKHSYSEY